MQIQYLSFDDDKVCVYFFLSALKDFFIIDSLITFERCLRNPSHYLSLDRFNSNFSIVFFSLRLGNFL